MALPASVEASVLSRAGVFWTVHYGQEKHEHKQTHRESLGVNVSEGVCNVPLTILLLKSKSSKLRSPAQLGFSSFALHHVNTCRQTNRRGLRWRWKGCGVCRGTTVCHLGVLLQLFLASTKKEKTTDQPAKISPRNKKKSSEPKCPQCVCFCPM